MVSAWPWHLFLCKLEGRVYLPLSPTRAVLSGTCPCVADTGHRGPACRAEQAHQGGAQGDGQEHEGQEHVSACWVHVGCKWVHDACWVHGTMGWWLGAEGGVVVCSHSDGMGRSGQA